MEKPGQDSTVPVTVTDDAVAAEAERIVGRASGGRWALGAIIAVVVVAGAGVGGSMAYRAHRERQAREVAMVPFAAAQVRVGNDWRRTRDGALLDEHPAHRVEVEAFALDALEVTAGHYHLCVEAGACTSTPKAELCTEHVEGQETHPINCVTFAQAEAYCTWVGKRLPTEPEWEYAAGGLAPHKRTFPWGRELPARRHANVCGRECTYGAETKGGMPSQVCGVAGCRSAVFGHDDGSPATAPVGSYVDGETPEGLADMAGNVWEWTRSAPCRYPDHDCDAKGERVIRGGGFTHRFVMTPEVTTRQKLPETAVNPGVGFRCAK